MIRKASSGRNPGFRSTRGSLTPPSRSTTARSPVGRICSPPLASAANADASSIGVTSKLPRTRAGTGSIGLVKPASRATRTTAS